MVIVFKALKKMEYNGTIAKILLSAIKRGFKVEAILNRKPNWYLLKKKTSDINIVDLTKQNKLMTENAYM